MLISRFRRIAFNAAAAWYKRDPFTSAAAAAYYAVFSFPAMILALTAVFGMFMDEAAIRENITGYLAHILGQEGAQRAYAIAEQSALKEKSLFALLLGGGLLFLAATRFFMQLQKAMNRIWECEGEKSAVRSMLRGRFASLCVILALGSVLPLSLLSTSLLTSLGEWLTLYIPAAAVRALHVLNILVSYLVLSVLFSFMLKMLPDTYVPKKCAAAGGAVSAALFVLGEYAMGLYFDKAEPASAYGVAGSLILLMIWVSYSCMILLFGAEFARAYTDDRKQRLKDKLAAQKRAAQAEEAEEERPRENA